MINLDINKILKISLIIVIGLCLIKYSSKVSNNLIENMSNPSAKSYINHSESSSNLSSGMRPVRKLAGVFKDSTDDKDVYTTATAKDWFTENVDSIDNIKKLRNRYSLGYGLGAPIENSIYYDERSSRGLNSLSIEEVNKIKRAFPIKVLLPNVVCNDGTSPFNDNGTAKDCTLKLGEPTEIPLNFKDKPINEVDPIYRTSWTNSGGYCNNITNCKDNNTLCVY